MLKIFFCVIVLAFCSTAFADIDYVKLDPISEVRAIWIDAGAIPKTDKGIRQMVRSYARANFNVLLPETICRGYTVYPSSLLERDPRFAGAVDPLPLMISEAHKLGLEVHPWVWVFRVGYTKDSGGILRAHPDWAELGRDGKELSPNGGLWVSPAIPAARDFLAALLAELTAKYQIDGLHLDYIRYETGEKMQYGYSPTSRELFKKQYGIDPIDIEPNSPDVYYWNKFRERQINTFVQRIALQTRAIRPNAIISAAVGPYLDDARLNLMQNWPNWAANKWVDCLMPMSYSSDDGHFRRLTARIKKTVDNEVILAPGLGLYAHNNVQQTISQIGGAREACAEGEAIFAGSYMKAHHFSGLQSCSYSAKALVPFRDPCVASQRLSNCAAALRSKGQAELADYYSCRSADLAAYVAYKQKHIGYIPPTAPPLNPAP